MSPFDRGLDLLFCQEASIELRFRIKRSKLVLFNAIVKYGTPKCITDEGSAWIRDLAELHDAVAEIGCELLALLIRESMENGAR